MITFTGKYLSKIDSKGRFVLPAIFKKEIPAGHSDIFVLEKDIYEKSIVLYPITIWEQRVNLLKSRLNFEDRKQAKMLSRFFEEVQKLQMAENGRINLPSIFLKHAEICDQVLITGQGDRIKIWNPTIHEDSRMNDQEFTDMFQEIIGGEVF